jgi:7-cyano-7-deazaguanine synthase
MSKNVILLSGGLDSTTLLAHALAAGDEIVSSLTFDYDQRHLKEIDAAAAVAGHYGVSHKVKTLGDVFGNSALTLGKALPLDARFDDVEKQTATVVPGRNLLFLSLAVCEACRTGASGVLFAPHAGDRAVYPDCRLEFVRSVDLASLCGYNVRILAPFIDKDKKWIARRAKELNVPTGLTWSCYAGEELPCGRCGACVERREAEESV